MFVVGKIYPQFSTNASALKVFSFVGKLLRQGQFCQKEHYNCKRLCLNLTSSGEVNKTYTGSKDRSALTSSQSDQILHRPHGASTDPQNFHR